MCSSDLLHEVDWSTTSFAGQARLAAQLLGLGVSRVATLGFSYSGWDTHANNDLYQSGNWQALFSQLLDLVEELGRWPGESAATLAEETVLVVLSEMGRTPKLNSNDGKDHWPYTSALLMGPGLTGGRVIGGYDTYYYGETIDPATGELDPNGENLAAEALGATLLQLAGVDPEEHTPGVEPITGVLTG